MASPGRLFLGLAVRGRVSVLAYRPPTPWLPHLARAAG